MLEKFVLRSFMVFYTVAVLNIIAWVVFILIGHNSGWFIPSGTYDLFEMIDLFNHYEYVLHTCRTICMGLLMGTLATACLSFIGLVVLCKKES